MFILEVSKFVDFCDVIHNRQIFQGVTSCQDLQTLPNDYRFQTLKDDTDHDFPFFLQFKIKIK